MQTSSSRSPRLNHASSQNFAAELPSQWQGGGAENGPANTQLSFSITTDTDSLSSGFPYSQQLAEIRISQTQWMHFSNQVVNAASLTAIEDKAAWTAGVATGAGASAFLLFFGPWNEGMFAERGVQASLEPPTESGEVVVDQWPGASRKDMERAKERMKKRFRIVQVPFDPRIHELGPSRVQLSPVLPLSQSQSSVRRSPSESHPTESSEGRRSQYLDEQEDAEEAPQLPPRKPGLGMNELASDQGVVELASEQTPVVLYELDGHSSEIQGNNYAGNDILSLKE
ncbi:hypothetical protein IFR04_007699 [Cadophora malorum]|uniref:Uncharacterized protein n=1 Tax=Cadophora malorum TaxID=108018 RepID=A0A8H7TI31_9HELO|nr:hypothetical protein IFR04_007699 [Cadophora malorum]